MTSTDHESVTDGDHRSAANTLPADGVVSPATRTAGLPFAGWCLGFAVVNAWQLATGRLTGGQFGGYTTALVVASDLVLLLKLTGAGIALASLRTVRHRGVRWLRGRSASGCSSDCSSSACSSSTRGRAEPR